MKEIFRMLIVVLLSPLYFATILFKGTFELIEPVAQDVGRPFIEVYNLMYEYWKKVFKW